MLIWCLVYLYSLALTNSQICSPEKIARPIGLSLDAGWLQRFL